MSLNPLSASAPRPARAAAIPHATRIAGAEKTASIAPVKAREIGCRPSVMADCAAKTRPCSSFGTRVWKITASSVLTIAAAKPTMANDNNGENHVLRDAKHS